MIYEDNEDMDKALQFGLIAAHLNPSDCDEWIRLADMSLEQDNIRQAVICYTKGQFVAASSDPSALFRFTFASLYLLEGGRGVKGSKLFEDAEDQAHFQCLYLGSYSIYRS